MRHLLLASEGRPFSPRSWQIAIDLARPARARITVLSVARIWGTSLGFPNPWLMPSAQEWTAQRAQVDTALRALQAAGLEATGRVVGSRNAARLIAREARKLGCDAVVMGADPPRHWLMAGLLWSQDPYRVRRRAGRPVHLALEGSGPRPEDQVRAAPPR